MDNEQHQVEAKVDEKISKAQNPEFRQTDGALRSTLLQIPKNRKGQACHGGEKEKAVLCERM